MLVHTSIAALYELSFYFQATFAVYLVASQFDYAGIRGGMS
jgi:hypothetical protein